MLIASISPMFALPASAAARANAWKSKKQMRQVPAAAKWTVTVVLSIQAMVAAWANAPAASATLLQILAPRKHAVRTAVMPKARRTKNATWAPEKMDGQTVTAMRSVA